MKTYEWILFDADDTLFSFDAISGLQRMFSGFNVDFTDTHFQEYQVTNKSLWTQYQNAEITAQDLKEGRFAAWAERLNVSPKTLNTAFLSAMADVCAPLEGATSLLNALKGKAKLGIITNGFTELQEIRLERTGLKDYFHMLVISEQVGIAKPHPGIFEHAFSIMGNPSREKVLMVGDNPDSDILGGMNAGIDTCWINATKRAAPAGITPQYQVGSLKELEELLFIPA